MSSFFFSHLWTRVLVFYVKVKSKKRRIFVCEPFLFSPLDEAGWCFMITRRGAWVSSSLQVTHTSPQGCIHIFLYLGVCLSCCSCDMYFVIGISPCNWHFVFCVCLIMRPSNWHQLPRLMLLVQGLWRNVRKQASHGINALHLYYANTENCQIHSNPLLLYICISYGICLCSLVMELCSWHYRIVCFFLFFVVVVIVGE